MKQRVATQVILIATLAVLFLVVTSRNDEGQVGSGTFGRSKPPKEQVPMIVVNL